MAEEPLPKTMTEGPEPPASAAATAEDRKAAHALDALDVKGGAGDAADESSNASKRNVDLKALNDAIRHLSVAGEPTGPSSSSATATASGDDKKGKKDDTPKKPLVKVDAADVNLLVEQLDINKVRATELLRAHDADATKAMLAWVTASS